MQVGIAAHGVNPSVEVEEKAKEFVRALAECRKDVTLVLGGYWGLMKVVVDEALRLGFRVVLTLPIEREDVELPEGVIRINTGCEFRCRSVMLVRSSDVLVSLGGGSGTAIEMLMAYAMGVPVFSLVNTGMPTDELAKAYPKYYDERGIVEVRYFTDPRELARAVCEHKGGRVKRPIVG
ncbi:MAG: LOG family protein [Thermoprotei archaeon]